MKNPYVNAIAAASYIVGIVLFVQELSIIGKEKQDTILIPMFMLSLFVFSVVCMGFFFLYRPLTLYLDDKKQEALQFFGRTVGTFAICVVVLFIAMVYSLHN